ncbi:hypothetical protein [Sporosarcina sp. FSL K6-1508]|uniref:hypothetical protein n=1 Tax=Sporosarcina sp. FSL K6-1508 TaxID=2921553 RepID=UPI0030F7CD5F
MELVELSISGGRGRVKTRDNQKFEYALMKDPGSIGMPAEGYIVDVESSFGWNKQLNFRGEGDTFLLENKYKLILVK